MKIASLITVLGIVVMTFGVPPTLAGEVDILIKKLVEKGILTQSDAKELVEEIKKETAKEKKEIKEVAKEAAKEEVKTTGIKLPKWVEKMKFKGDVRLRYQGGETDPATPGLEPTHRSRGRFRLRLGASAKINEQWKAGFRIVSGGADPRSSNQTMQNTFDSSGWMLDKAYAEYKPMEGLKLVGGKFGNPIWRAKDLMWDGDVNPEGVAAQFTYKDKAVPLELFFTPAFFILEEFGGDTADPVMWAAQGGLKWKFGNGKYIKFAPTYYATDNISGNDFTAGGAWGRGTNSRAATGAYLFEYNAFAGDIELGFTKFTDFMPFIALFAQYVQSDVTAALNVNGLDDDTGYLYGIKFGHKKTNKFGLWQAKYNYRHLESDAWPDFLPDSDFYGGRTNAKGSEFEFKFGIHKNVTLGLDYYNSRLLRVPVGSTERDQDILQLDLILKW